LAGTDSAQRKLTMADIRAAAERLKNWGRWGAEDQVGTLNLTRPEDIVAAARLVQKGKVMSLALGDAPGLAFETLDWLQAKQVAAIATDTWGVEVRPNQTDEATQPWHWIAIPIMGLTLGEIFYLAELASDCAEDKRYEFLFVAPALPITGAVASPINPLAIK
jgi:kynurenine formamidase